MPRMMLLAYASYAGLFVSVMTLAEAANLFATTFWSVIVLLMLAGYLLAPHGIWHLCVGTHDHEDEEDAPAAPALSVTRSSVPQPTARRA
jgi:hypothetical protein